MTQISAPSNLAMRGFVPLSQPFHARVAAAGQAQNPLFEAARPLLQALADTPRHLDDNALSERHRWLEHEVRTFERVCAELQLRRDHVQYALYCLCSALDEAAMQTEWGRGAATGVEWSSNGLAVAFGQDRQGADRVYQVIEQVLRNPDENRDLLDVIQNILDLGFQGRYRFEKDGPNKLMSVRQWVHDAVMTAGSMGAEGIPQPLPPVGWRVSARPLPVRSTVPLPVWRVDPWVRPAPTRKTRPWLAICCAVLLCSAGAVLAEKLIWNRPPPIDVLASNLQHQLKSEIAAGVLGVEENAQHTALTLRFSDMFAPGQVGVNAWMKPLIATVGREITATPGMVQVTGYTDSLPAGKSMFASNQALSEARAQQVMRILLAAGLPSDRLSGGGKGDANPVADNQRPAGRTKNRRVEIIVSDYRDIALE